MLKGKGEFRITFDAKGRFMLPAAYLRRVTKDDLSFVVSRGFEGCLTFYTNEQWEAKEQKLYNLNEFDPEHRQFQRLFLNGATEVEKDAAGRVLIGKSLLESAGITKDAIFYAYNDKVEIWDEIKYRKQFDISAEDYSALAKKVMVVPKNNPE